jgi:hypothetical protein
MFFSDSSACMGAGVDVSQKIQWSVVSGQLIVVLCQKIETTGQPLSFFSAHGSRLTAHGPYFHGSRVTGRSWQLPRKYGFRFPVSGFWKIGFIGRDVPAVSSFLVGRASVPAQISPRNNLYFHGSWVSYVTHGN